MKTRWTFFRVKLLFEFDFEISLSLGPLDLGTPGPWNPWTLGLLDLLPTLTIPHTSPYILLYPPISSSYSPPLVWLCGRGVVTLEDEIGDGPLTFILIPWDLFLPSTFSSSNLFPPPSYSSQLLHPPPTSYLLFYPPTSSQMVSGD